MEKNLRIAIRLIAALGLGLGICIAIIQEQRYQIQNMHELPSHWEISVAPSPHPHFLEIQEQVRQLRCQKRQLNEIIMIKEEVEREMEAVREELEDIEFDFQISTEVH